MVTTDINKKKESCLAAMLSPLVLLSKEAFFAQDTRFISHVRDITVSQIRREYKRDGMSLGRMLDQLVAMALPGSAEQETLMRQQGVDVNAYVNDNLLVVVNKLSAALFADYRHVPALECLMDGMWALYIDTMRHPFEHTTPFVANSARSLALESFHVTLWTHLIKIGTARSTVSRDTQDDALYRASFLNAMLCFARSVFESRAFYEPLPHGVSPVGNSLWHTYLAVWGIPAYY